MKFHQMLERHAAALENNFIPQGYDGPPPTDPRQVQGWLDMLDRWAKAPKAQAVDPNDDDAFIYKVSHAMKRGEKLMQFVARTGLGRAQALAMSRQEISNFVRQSEANAVNEIAPPGPQVFQIKPPPPRAPQNLVMVG
jgi:hypothetical protein